MAGAARGAPSPRHSPFQSWSGAGVPLAGPVEPPLVLLPHTCILTECREAPASRSGSGSSQQELLFHSSLLLKFSPVFSSLPSLARVGLECLWKCLLSVDPWPRDVWGQALPSAALEGPECGVLSAKRGAGSVSINSLITHQDESPGGPRSVTEQCGVLLGGVLEGREYQVVNVQELHLRLEIPLKLPSKSEYHHHFSYFC